MYLLHTLQNLTKNEYCMPCMYNIAPVVSVFSLLIARAGGWEQNQCSGARLRYLENKNRKFRLVKLTYICTEEEKGSQLGGCNVPLTRSYYSDQITCSGGMVRCRFVASLE